MVADAHPVLSAIEGFFLRWLAAIALVFGTYNPSGYCYVSWVKHASQQQFPYILFVGLLIILGFAIFFRAAKQSLGIWGVGLLIVFFGSGIWSLSHLGILDLTKQNMFVYVTLLTLATIMSIGLDWSIIRRALSGQLDVE